MPPPQSPPDGPEAVVDDAAWLDALHDAWMRTAIEPERDRDEFDVFVSGAVAEWADHCEEDDLAVAAGQLRDRADTRDELRPVADAIAGLLGDGDSGLALLEVHLVAEIDRSIESYALVFGRGGEATHTLLVDIGEGDQIVGVLFGDGDVATAAIAEAAVDGVSVASQLVPDGELHRVHDRLSTALANPLPDRHANRANAFAAAHRLRVAGVSVAVRAPRTIAVPYEPRPVDPEADRYAAELLRGALGEASDPPDAVVDHARQLLTAPRPAALGDMLAVVAIPEGEGDEDPVAALLAAVAAFVHPLDLSMFSEGERELIDSLEWADWLGAALPAIRSGIGASMTPSELVDNINRCPEVTTTIPKRDRPAVEAAFGLVLPGWVEAGVIDAESRLTDVGPWLLTEALRQAATGSS